MTIYEIKKDEFNNVMAINRTNEDGSHTSIPIDLGNTDYQAYLATL